MGVVDVGVIDVLIARQLMLSTVAHGIRSDVPVLIENVPGSVVTDEQSVIRNARAMAGFVPDIAAGADCTSTRRDSVLCVRHFACQIVGEKVLGLSLALLLARDRSEQAWPLWIVAIGFVREHGAGIRFHIALRHSVQWVGRPVTLIHAGGVVQAVDFVRGRIVGIGEQRRTVGVGDRLKPSLLVIAVSEIVAGRRSVLRYEKLFLRPVIKVIISHVDIRAGWHWLGQRRCRGQAVTALPLNDPNVPAVDEAISGYILAKIGTGYGPTRLGLGLANVGRVDEAIARRIAPEHTPVDIDVVRGNAVVYPGQGYGNGLRVRHSGQVDRDRRAVGYDRAAGDPPCA